MAFSVNLKSRTEQIKLLRDSPALADRIAARLLIKDDSLTLADANRRATFLVTEWEKYQNAS